MKVSGFTFVRNAIKYDYPIVEAISSALPIVDEFVVNVGKSDDETLELIRSIDSPKIRIFETEWDDNLKVDGRIFGIQQDLALSRCTGDWALLLQADEVLHEDDLPTIEHAMHQYLNKPEILGLVFRMLHFKGDYWSLDPWMYHKATRVVRRTESIRSTTDCCDFVVDGVPGMIKSGPHGALIKARIFHYGWVKDPGILREKLRFQISRHEGERWSQAQIDEQAMILSAYPTYDILKEFRGTHPKVMEARIKTARRLRPRRNRWLNPRFYAEVLRHGFKG
jgi:hypothetical protein